MYQINNHSILGYLGDNPKIYNSQSGLVIANFSVGTTAKWKNKATGVLEEKTSWHNVVVFREATVKFVEKSLVKGSLVFVQGTPQIREYQDKEGKARAITEVVVAGPLSQVILPDPFARQLSVGKIAAYPASLFEGGKGVALEKVARPSSVDVPSVPKPAINDLEDEKIPF